MRLVLIDPNGPDDRQLAAYCAHVASDPKAADGSNLMASNGIGRMKPITSQWQPFNYFSQELTWEILQNNPPPYWWGPNGEDLR